MQEWIQQGLIKKQMQGQGQVQVQMRLPKRLRATTTPTTTSTTFAPPLPPELSAGVYVGQAPLEAHGAGGGGFNSADVGDGIDGASSSPLQYVQALQKERFEQHRAELLARAAGGQDAGESQKWVAQRWLVVPPVPVPGVAA